jgi:hypothetical protein
MGHWEWGIGNGALGMGHWEWGIGNSWELEFAISPTSLSAAGI